MRLATQAQRTADQQHYRKEMALKSRKTPTSPPDPMSIKYTTTIGRRSGALYRLESVSGQHPAGIDMQKLITDAMAG